MKTIFCMVLCIVFTLLLVLPLSAEYYQWVDKKGVKHFTDNVSDIPKDQRPNASVYQSVKTPDVPQEEPVQPTKTNPVDPRAKTLSDQQQKLDAEYKRIMEEKKDLLSRQKTMNLAEYNKQIEVLNTRISQFEEKRLAYEAQVSEYKEKTEDTP